jgi:hypothetical protein
MLNNYLIVWIAYLLSAAGLLLVFWRMTRSMRAGWLKAALRSLLPAILLTPVSLVEGEQWLAPAYLVAAYDWVLGNQERALLAAALLAMVWASVLGLLLLQSLLRRVFHLEQHS